jgi:ribose/xylose/arabinose/galactoside ABC-type transport system permease subunit
MLKIPAFIVTLGTFNLMYGFSLYITNSTTLNPTYPPPDTTVHKSQLDFFTGLSEQIGKAPNQISLEVFWMIGLALVVAFLLHRSLFGFRTFAIGGNAAAARLARLPVRRYKVLAFVLAAVLAGAAGILDFSYASSIQPDAGLLPLTFPVFAAVVIGGASLNGGKGTVVGTVFGAFLLASLQVGLALLSLGNFAQQLFLGIVTIAAVALDLGAQRLNARRA